MTDKNSELVVFAKIKPKKEYYEECVQTLLDLREITLKEPGCRQFDLFKAEPFDGYIYFFERFDNQAAIDLHLSYPYTQNVFVAYKEWLAEEVVVTKTQALYKKLMS